MRALTGSNRQQNGNLTFRGRTLSLSFTDGSPCGESDERKRALLPHTAEDIYSRDTNSIRASGTSKHNDDDDDDEDNEDEDDDDDSSSKKKHRPSSTSRASSKPTSTPSSRRKNTIISFLCDREPAPKSPKVSVNFVHVTEDECTYVFNARSPAACPSVNVQKTSLGPSGVFSVMWVLSLLWNAL